MEYNLQDPDTIPPSLRGCDPALLAVYMTTYGAADDFSDQDEIWLGQRRALLRGTSGSVQRVLVSTDSDMDDDHFPVGINHVDDFSDK
jgi:hypothetical protein